MSRQPKAMKVGQVYRWHVEPYGFAGKAWQREAVKDHGHLWVCAALLDPSEPTLYKAYFKSVATGKGVWSYTATMEELDAGGG